MKSSEMFFTQTQLLKERRWTKQQIDTFLTSPCLIKKNPIYRSSSPMKLFRASRVIEVESSDAYKSSLAQLDERRKNSSKITSRSVLEKKENLLKYINELSIEIPLLETRKLYSLACQHYNDLWTARDEIEKYATTTDEIEFLNRISINYLRHCMSCYHEELEKMSGVCGKEKAYLLLKRKILIKIAENYSFLKDAVMSQLAFIEIENNNHAEKGEIL